MDKKTIETLEEELREDFRITIRNFVEGMEILGEPGYETDISLLSYVSTFIITLAKTINLSEENFFRAMKACWDVTEGGDILPPQDKPIN